MSVHYTWSIESINTKAKTMVVCYIREGTSSRLLYEIDQPLVGQDLGSIVDLGAPQALWARELQAENNQYQDLVPGTTGTSRDLVPETVS